MIPKLGKVQRVDVRSAWMNEALHFTPWLASEEGMELLQETLDMELEVEATEKFVGPFKADILAKRTDTTDDHWVLIENQLERTDHRHLGQLLTYAAGLDAVTIVWIAESFAEEHRAALDWLNDVTSESLQFFGLEIELWQIEGSPPAPMLNVIAEPNEWSREVKQSADKTLTDMQRLQLRYWKGVGEIIDGQGGSVRAPKPPAQSWVSYPIGKSGAWLGSCVNSFKKRAWVEFCCYGPPGKVWFDQLHAKREQIEAALGYALEWKRLDGKKMSKVIYALDPADPTDEADWSRQHKWIAEHLEQFHKAFQPHVLELIDEAPTADT